MIGTAAHAQAPVPPPSFEVSDIDGIPVLIKHLPQWTSVREKATLTTDLAVLRAAVGGNPVLDRIEFIPATEAVTAPYEAGRLVIIEYPSPQPSVETDNIVHQYLAENGGNAGFVYRRIGNYNVFVFEPTDPEAAVGLLDQVKYEKHIQWLGEDPFAQNRAERNFVITTSDIFLSTLFAILIGIGFSIVGGLLAGWIYFMMRERRRAAMPEFSDAGGMTRLNLDSLTPDFTPHRLLKD